MALKFSMPSFLAAMILWWPSTTRNPLRLSMTMIGSFNPLLISYWRPISSSM